MIDEKTGLTEKELLFIREYCKNGFNGTKAAIKAGYSKNSAKEIASQNLTKLNIKNEIKKYLDEVLQDYKDTLEYEIIQTYKILAFYDPADIIDNEGGLRKKNLKSYKELSKCIKGIQTTYNAKGQKQIKILLQDRDCALEKLAQYMALLTYKADITSKGERISDVSDIIKHLKEKIIKDDNK